MSGKQVTVLFADVKDSMELLADRDLEEECLHDAAPVLDRTLLTGNELHASYVAGVA